ncbi:MAG TPA: hypothetical protein VGK86_12935 [Thermoanaerobaculia bacterium]|jgi:hypothetical protein
MITLLVLFLALSGTDSGAPWEELTLSIERDHQTSSDTVTLCRVRVTNHGSRSWPGRKIGFEARALDGATVVARERGRFGYVLAPYGSLETLIGFVGRYDRFEVVAGNGAGERAPRDRGVSRRRKRRARPD